MTKQEFLSELERALGKLPHTEVEQALAFYDEAISDRMEDGLSEAEAVAGLGSIEEIAAQIAAETPAHPARHRAGQHRQPHPSTSCCSRCSPPSGYPSHSRARGGRRARRVHCDLGRHSVAMDRRRGPRAHALHGNRRAHLDPGRGMPLPGVFVLGLSLVSSGFASSPPSPCSGRAGCSSGQREPSRAGSRACSCA